MDAKTIIRTGIELWNAHDREGFLALYDDAVSFVDQATGHQLVGREEFGKGFYDLWTDAYPDNELKDPIVFAEGELVCFQGRFVGTNTGIFHAGEMEMPPTGKPIDAPFVFIAEVRDGTVKRAWHYYDRLLAYEQEGILTVEKLFAQLPVA
jgi:ketosteroid isomerase-like protein